MVASSGRRSTTSLPTAKSTIVSATRLSQGQPPSSRALAQPDRPQPVAQFLCRQEVGRNDPFRQVWRKRRDLFGSHDRRLAVLGPSVVEMLQSLDQVIALPAVGGPPVAFDPGQEPIDAVRKGPQMDPG